MKGFSKMTKVTWKFYLVALVVMLLLTFADSLYVCREAASSYNGKLFHYGMEQDSAEEFMEKNGGILDSGNTVAWIYNDKVNYFQLFGYYPILIVLIVITLLKQCVFMDARTAEFQRTFPVRQWVQILHDYFSVLGIIMISALLQLGIFLAYQTSYNMEMLKAARLFSISNVTDGIISSTNERLLLYWGVYFLYVIVAYTWMYVGMLLAKNPVAGVILSLFVRGGLLVCCREVFYGFTLPYDDIYMYHLDFFHWLDDLIDDIGDPSGVFNMYRAHVLTTEVGIREYLIPIVGGLLVILLLLLLVMLFVSKRRELSRGKLLYFPILDYPVCFLIGMCIWEYFDEMVFCLTIAFIIFVLIHPWTQGKRKVLEVR